MQRPPTSHERLAGQPWDASYSGADPAPWDIGHPQPAVVRLADKGVFAGAVLDAGCGTGDNALHLAALGLSVLGVDVAATAVRLAREKARGVDARFEVADALRLDRLGRTFDTVLDCALFHAFDNDERAAYAASLAAVTKPGAGLYVFCFGDGGPADTLGPHPVSQAELRAAFDDRWSVTSIDAERLESHFAPDGAPAWLATIRRT
jgi:SAM-dependent methyltransferase